MNFNLIITAVKQFLVSLAALAKETVRLPHARMYLLISPVLILVFTLFMYPVDIYVRKGIDNIEKEQLAQFNTGTIDINYIGDSSVDQFDARFRDGDELRLQDVVLDMNILGLIVRHVLGSGYNPEGSISITKLMYETQKTKITGSLTTNFDLVIQPPPAGLKDGTISVLLQNTKLTVKSFTLPDEMGGLEIDIPSIYCPSIAVDLAISENSIQVGKAAFSGTDLKGTLSGSIDRSRFFKNSPLNLDLSINESSKVLERYRMLMGKFINNGVLVIKIRGTVDRPTYELTK